MVVVVISNGSDGKWWTLLFFAIFIFIHHINAFGRFFHWCYENVLSD